MEEQVARMGQGSGGGGGDDGGASCPHGSRIRRECKGLAVRAAISAGCMAPAPIAAVDTGDKQQGGIRKRRSPDAR
jgi:hypothetical protein